MASQNILRACEGEQINFGFATVLDLHKCLKQINLPNLLHTFAPISELPFAKSTMENTHKLGSEAGKIYIFFFVA